VRNGDLFDAFEGLCAGGNIVDGVKDLGAVIAQSTNVADADGYSFEYDETLFILESLAVDFFRANGSLTMFALVTIVSFLSGIC